MQEQNTLPVVTPHQAGPTLAADEFRALVETLPDLFYRFRLSPPGFDYISSASIRLLGYSPEEFYADPELLVEVVYPDDRPLLEDLLQHPEHFENPPPVRWVRKDGGVVWTEQHNTLLRDDAGRIVAVQGVARDITAREQGEEALRRSEERYRALVTASSYVVYRMSPDWTEMRELEGRGFIADTDSVRPSWLGEYIPSEEQPLVKAAIQEAIRTKTMFELEHRVRRVDGSLGWTLSRAVPLLNEQDEIVEWFGVASDITARKQADKERGTALVKYKTLFDSFPLGITVSDRQGRVVETNRLAEKLLGVPAAEHTQRAIDGPQWHIIHPDGSPMPPAEFASVRALQEKRLVENVEMGIVKSPAETTWLNVSAVPLPLEDYGLLITYADIGERKRAEDALARTTSRLTQVLESIQDDFYVLDRDWKFVFANRQFTSRIGKEPSDFVGNCIWEMFPKHVGSVLWENFRASMEKGEVRRFEVGGQYSEAWYSMASFPSSEGIIVLGSDITARKRAEEALRASEERFRVAQETSPDGFTILRPLYDEQGQFIDFVWEYENAAVARMNGTTPDQVVGRRLLDLFPGHRDTRFYRTYRQVLETGQPAEFEEHYQGESITNDTWFRIVTVPLGGGVANLAQDITARKQAEREREILLQRERELRALAEAARQQAEAAVLVRDHFIALASHELKTPLASMRGYTELLMQRATDLSEQNGRMVRTVYQQTLRLEKMISALLDISRIERGQLSIEHEPVELGALLTGLVQDIRPTLRRHTLEFTPASEPVVVEGDEARLEQVVQNLIQNAVKYSPHGGLVGVCLTRQAGNARITVSDEGIGIPPAALARLFTRFFRADNAEEYHINGLGIGLYVAREIVSLHGGGIDVESREGKGSTFTVWLPIP